MAASSKTGNLRGKSRRPKNESTSLLDPPTDSLMTDNIPTLWMPSPPQPVELRTGVVPVQQQSDVAAQKTTKTGAQPHTVEITTTPRPQQQQQQQQQHERAQQSPHVFDASLFTQPQQTSANAQSTTMDIFTDAINVTPIPLVINTTATDIATSVGHATTTTTTSSSTVLANRNVVMSSSNNQSNNTPGTTTIATSPTSNTNTSMSAPTHDIPLQTQSHIDLSSDGGGLPLPSYEELSHGVEPMGDSDPPPPYYTPETPPYCPGPGSPQQPEDVNQTADRNIIDESYNESMSFEKYEPVCAHWFFSKTVENKQIWLPFSHNDSTKLEYAYNTTCRDPNVIVATDGGRYDVVLFKRVRYPVYWEEKVSEVRRCTWFYKRSQFENVFLPYDESFSSRLEMEFRSALISNSWHRRIDLNNAEAIVMHNPNVLVHFISMTGYDTWGNPVEQHTRFRTLKRGVDDSFDISEGVPDHIDHLVFVVHGIGPVADLRFRDLVQCVNDFRCTSDMLMGTHFSGQQSPGRVEYLPVSWHHILHSDATGVDNRMKSITLPSIGRLRHFINETLLDILFYTSPVYCQTISDAVCSDMNRLYSLFLTRNPDFSGTVATAGHSLGAVILFDLLAHQGENSLLVPSELSRVGSPMRNDVRPSPPQQGLATDVTTLDQVLRELGLTQFKEVFDKEQIDLETLKLCNDEDLKELGITMGPRKKLLQHMARLTSDSTQPDPTVEASSSECPDEEPAIGPAGNIPRHASVSVDFTPGLAGTGQPMVRYAQLAFKPIALFAFGSPIGMFLTVRGINTVGINYQLPTCPAFFNIYHPYDPVAYRIEPIVNSDYFHVKPVLIPHHKGRKRLHLELRDSISRVGADLKRGLLHSMKSTVNALHELAFSKTPPGPVIRGAPSASQTSEVTPSTPLSPSDDTEDYVLTGISDILTDNNHATDDDTSSSTKGPDDFVEISKNDVSVGRLNSGCRIDYVLQEKTVESLNEYLFAMATHLCYWDSEDTALMVLRQMYSLASDSHSVPNRNSGGPSH